MSTALTDFKALKLKTVTGQCRARRYRRITYAWARGGRRGARPARRVSIGVGVILKCELSLDRHPQLVDTRPRVGHEEGTDRTQRCLLRAAPRTPRAPAVTTRKRAGGGDGGAEVARAHLVQRAQLSRELRAYDVRSSVICFADAQRFVLCDCECVGAPPVVQGAALV